MIKEWQEQRIIEMKNQKIIKSEKKRRDGLENNKKGVERGR